MRDNFISNFSDFSYSINEGNQYKKGLGIIGPFSDWGYKIKTSYPESEGADSDQNAVISGLSDDGEDFSLSYLYGDGKKSDPVFFPKLAFLISGDLNAPILQTKKNHKWWDSEENQNCLDDFLDSFVESKHFSHPEEKSAEGDILSVMEILGLDCDLSRVDKKKENHWIGYLEDGSEIELKKQDGNDFFKNLQIYQNSESTSPQIEIYRDKPGFETIFNTPKGKFCRKTPALTDLAKDPIHKYLFYSSMERDPALYHEPVINYLNSILKSHDWRPKSKKYLDSVNSKSSELDQIKRMLMNTLSEEILDEMYSKAREKFTLGSVNP